MMAITPKEFDKMIKSRSEMTELRIALALQGATISEDFLLRIVVTQQAMKKRGKSFNVLDALHLDNFLKEHEEKMKEDK